MRRWWKLFGLAALTTVACSGMGQDWNFVKVDPKATYLRDSQSAPLATRIQLERGKRQGRMLELRTVGYYNRAADNLAAKNISSEAIAVFSANGELDPDWSKRFRVGQAVDAGTDFLTLPTWEGNQATDIGEDFGLRSSSSVFHMSETAEYLFVSAFDNGFWNNCDDFSKPGADPRGFGVEWRFVEAVPEPASLAAVAVGLFGIRRSKRKR